MTHTTTQLFRLVLTIAVVAIATTSCGGQTNEPSESSLVVIATTTMLGDVASNIIGTDGTVEVLLPIGADSHDYQASAQQIASLQIADLVIANGLDLEEGLEDVLDTAADDGANILKIGEQLQPIPFGTDGDHGHSDDPHVWLDPLRMAEAGRIIATELTRIQQDIDWQANAETYAKALEEADASIVDILSAVPDDRRKLVANHDALGYFAARYGFTVIGTVVPGGSTLGEPSSAALAELVKTIQVEGVPAIFAETTEPAALAEAVAGELDDAIEVVDLYTGSLGGPGSGAETLIDMLTTNAQLIAEALS